MTEFEEGKYYMFASPGAWMWTGRFVCHSGLFGAVFSDVVNICRTGGTPWPELAQGKGREGARFQTYSPGPMYFNVIQPPILPWAGKLPR